MEKPFPISVFKACYILTILSTLLIYIAQPFHFLLLETIASRCFLICNLIALLSAFLHSLRRYQPYKTRQIVTIIFMIAFSFISYQSTSNGGIYPYVIRLLCYLALPIYLLYIDYLKPERIMIFLTLFINFLSSLVFIALSFSSFKYKGYEIYIGTDAAWLTLGYNNPNQTAMYLLVTIILLLCTFYYYNNFFIKCFLAVDILYMEYLMFDTSSRTSIVISILIIVIAILKKRYHIDKSVAAVILLLPTIFMLSYSYLYNNGWILFDNFYGKADYSSRSTIFHNAFSSIKDQIFLGDYNSYQLQNLHNGTLSILVSLGIIGLIIFYVYYYHAYSKILSGGIKCKTAFIAIVGLLAVFLHACTESAFLTGGSVFAGSLSMLIFFK